jgi:two-component system alkaline phosphatase synthesis response regulator PhoP
MFVDDDKGVRDTWELIFRDSGYDAVFAPDAETALKLAEQEKPDLLVTDILLPHMDGIELCKKIREIPKLELIRIILITGVFKDIEFRAKLDRSVADFFILKPIDKDELLKKIKELLDIK